MRLFLILFLPFILYAQALDLPILYDPFQKAKKILKKAKEPQNIKRRRKKRIVLIAIFNDEAFINRKFYKKGDKIDGYILYDIKETYIVLKKKRRKKIIPLRKKRVIGIEKNE